MRLSWPVVTSTAQRLAAIRGDAPPKRHNARTIAALTGNPGCSRRAVLDGAGVDKPALAERVGFPARFGQSRFAITRGNAFEAQVKADGGAELLRLVARAAGRTGAGAGRLDGPGAARRRHGRPRARSRRRADRRRAGRTARRCSTIRCCGLDVGGSAGAPGTGPGRRPARRPVPRRGDQVVPGGRRPGRPGARWPPPPIQSAVYVLALRELLAAERARPGAGVARRGAGLPARLRQPAGGQPGRRAQAAAGAAPPAGPAGPARRPARRRAEPASPPTRPPSRRRWPPRCVRSGPLRPGVPGRLRAGVLLPGRGARARPARWAGRSARRSAGSPRSTEVLALADRRARPPIRSRRRPPRCCGPPPGCAPTPSPGHPA